MKSSFFVIVFMCLSSLAIANPLPQFPFVAVYEKHEIDVKPDLAVLSFSIKVFNAQSVMAQAALSDTRIKILDALALFKVPNSQLESYRIDKNIIRNFHNKNEKFGIQGYEITQDFSIKLKQLKKYSDIVATLNSLDYVSDIYPDFKITKEDKYKSQLVKLVSDKARKTADLLALAQGREVLNVYGMSLDADLQAFYARFALKDRRSLSFGMPSKNLVMTVPETIKLTATINAIYELK